MTLILTVANTGGVYQSSDFKLTDLLTGAPLSDRAGSKQLQASYDGVEIDLAFTGIATIDVGSKRCSTVEWLAAELRGLPDDSRRQGICERLVHRCEAVASPFGVRGVLTLVLTVSAIGEPFRIAVISNADWSERPPKARPKFRIEIHTVAGPYVLISGCRDCVPSLERHRLKALAKDPGRPATEVLKALADVNAVSARSSRGYVSEACWVTSRVADGGALRSAGRNVGLHPGSIPQVISGLDVRDWVRTNVRAAPGQELRLVQSAGRTAGPGFGTSSPPTGESRRIALSGSSVTAALPSASAARSAMIEITQLDCLIELRCNEEIIVPFATVVLSGFESISGGFPRPLIPWPHISPMLVLDEAIVPRGWAHSVCYWIEGGVHHAVVPPSSRSIRNLAFLGPDDELVITTPLESMDFDWGAREVVNATLEARTCWRSRVDGTRG